MAETMLDVSNLPRQDAYLVVADQLRSILHGVQDEITAMATMSCVLHHGFGHLWTGFYRVVAPALLRVGPYQGSLGCLEIPFGKGVCGTAAARKQTVVVPDVHAFPGHITCDTRSRSEIVVPVLGQQGQLLAVLDIDSSTPGTFGEADARELEALMTWFARAG